MRLLDLFEYDPRIAGAASKAASGIGQAADKLKGPLPLSAKMQDMETYLADFNKYVNTKRSKTPDYSLSVAFADWAKSTGDKAGIDSFNLKVEPDKIVQNGKPNSKYVRGLISKMINAINDKAKADDARAPKGGGSGIFKSRPEKF